MNTLITVLITIIIALTGTIAYELCFTVTTLGGYLPWAGLTLAPLVTYVIGRVL